MRVLITGGAGFIGSHLAEHLIARGDEVYALDDLSTGRVQNLANLKDNPNFHLIVDSVLQPAIVNELVNKVDVVYHLAAAVGVKTIVEQPVRTLRVVNVICGANSMFRAKVFAELVKQDATYAVDDMFWLAEIARRQLGRVQYVHAARSWTIDPHTFREWYRQTVRWSWGQFQSVRGHRLGMPVKRQAGTRFGLRWSWFDLAYLALLLDWLPYMLEPLAVVPVAYFLRGWIDPTWILIFYLATSFAWIGIGAVALRKPRLFLLAPAILALDLIYRVTMLHALAKAIVKPTTDVCAWDSPERFSVIPRSSTVAVEHATNRPRIQQGRTT